MNKKWQPVKEAQKKVQEKAKKPQKHQKPKKPQSAVEKEGNSLTKNQIKFLDSLKENLGIVSKAAHACGLHRNNHVNWYKSSKKYQEEFDYIKEDCIDYVENALMGKIEEGDTASIIFYLKTQAKKRGYVERSEVETRVDVVKPGIIKWGDKEINV
jgi:hypothetical protein